MREGSMRLAAAAGLQVKTPHLSENAETVRLMAAVSCHLCALREASVRSDMWCHLRCTPAAWMAPNTSVYIYLCYIITNTMCSSFKTTLWWKRLIWWQVAELQSSWTHDFWALQQLYYFWIYASLACTKHIYLCKIFSNDVHLMKLFNIFSWFLQPYWASLTLPANWISLPGCSDYHKTPEKPTSRLKHQPVFISALYPKSRTRIEIKNFITKISYTHLHFTV